jgi:hypothetical protein
MLFEQYCHDALSSKSNSYEVRNLEDNTKSVCELGGYKLAKIFSSAQQIKDPNLYYIPLSDRNPSYDSVDFCGIAFQMTVSLTHGLKHLPLVDLRKTLELKDRQLHVYFVVPRDI